MGPVPGWLRQDICVLEDARSFFDTIVEVVVDAVMYHARVAVVLAPTDLAALRKTLATTLCTIDLASCGILLCEGNDLDDWDSRLREIAQETWLGGWDALQILCDVGAVAAGRPADDILAYLARLPKLGENQGPVGLLHIYSPSTLPSEHRWRLLRAHPWAWTGETLYENFYYTGQPPLAPPGFDTQVDLERNLDHLHYQGRQRDDLMARAERTEGQADEVIRELVAVNDVSHALCHSHDTKVAMGEALRRTLELLHMEAGTVRTTGLEQELVLFHTSACLQTHDIEAFVACLDVPAMLASGQVQWASDARQHPPLNLPETSPVGSYLACPLTSSGRTVGLLVAVSGMTRTFTLQDIHVVTLLAAQLGVTLENVRLSEDNSRSHRNEDQLRRHAFKADRLASIGQWVSRLAREVQVPLGGLVRAFDTLLAQPLDTSTLSQLQTMQREAGRAGKILSDVINYVREPNRRRAPVDVNSLVQQALQHPGLQDGLPVDTEMKLAERLPAIPGDREQLEELIVHLVRNGRQAMGEAGGRLTITSRSSAQDVTITVRDTGPGIAEDQLEAIFKPFHTTRPAGTGVGLGLAISRGIAEDHGGRLSVSSPAGQGALFVVTLPVVAPAAAPEHGTVKPPAARSETPTPIRVLAVEDDYAIQRLMARFLQTSGYEVEMVGSGQGALEKLAQGHWDVVVCDVGLPDMTGLEVRKRARTSGPLPTFLFTSGDIDDPALTAYVTQHGCRTLRKPFNGSLLIQAVAEVLTPVTAAALA